MSAKVQINEDIRRLCGIGPRYRSLSESKELPDKPKDPAQVASKEAEGAPETKENGGVTGAGSGEKQAKVGGYDGGPGMQRMATKAPAAEKEGGEHREGGGETTASVGGAQGGPKMNPKAGKAPDANKEGGYRDEGGGEKEPKAGGATPGTANRKDDGLRAESRQDRMMHMKSLLDMLESDVSEEEDHKNEPGKHDDEEDDEAEDE